MKPEEIVILAEILIESGHTCIDICQLNEYIKMKGIGYD